MKRESVNRVRAVLEGWVPPVLRDSALMRWLFRLHWGRFVDDLEDFRANIHVAPGPMNSRGEVIGRALLHIEDRGTP